jgi:hypothetical protein
MLAPVIGRAACTGVIALVVALAVLAAHPHEARALSFDCLVAFLGGPGYPDANDPGPPNGVNQCSGKVDDKAPPGPPEGESQEDIFDAFLPLLGFNPTDTFTTPPSYGPGITVGSEGTVFPAMPMIGEQVEPGTQIYRMIFPVDNPSGSGKDPGNTEPAVSYTIFFDLPARLKITPDAIAGLSQEVGGSAGLQLTVTNISNDTPVKVDDVALGGAGAGAFKVDGCLNMTLPPQGTCPLMLNFTPGAADSFPVSVTVSGNDGSKAKVSGTGTGTTKAGTSSGGGTKKDNTGKNDQPCDCSKVTGFLNDFGVYHDSTRLSFKLNTTTLCTAGTGKGCNGRVSLLAPRGMFFVTPPVKGAKGPVRHKTMKVECSGKCAKSTSKTVTFTLLALRVRDPRFLPKGRGEGKPLEMALQTTCISPGGVLRPPDRKKLEISFKPNGNVDYKKSDLDGDGRPDGRQLK